MYYKIGDCFEVYFEGDLDYCMLCQVDFGKICFISLLDGNRYFEPYKVSNPAKIFDEDLNKMLSKDMNFDFLYKPINRKDIFYKFN
jgi:hypothetical protein